MNPFSVALGFPENPVVDFEDGVELGDLLVPGNAGANQQWMTMRFLLAGKAICPIIITMRMSLTTPDRCRLWESRFASAQFCQRPYFIPRCFDKNASTVDEPKRD